MLRNLVCLLVLLIFAPTAMAAVVAKVKGKNALIELKGDTASPGDLFYAINAEGKRRAILRIAKVKGGKAIAKVLKGKADAGMTLELRPASVTAGKKRSSPSERGSAGGNRRSYWGGMAGFAMDSMKVDVNDSTTNLFRETVSMSGTGFSGQGLFDYELFPQIWFRGLGGIEMFNASGSSVCGTGNRETCDAKMTYLSLDLIGRYVFSIGNFRPWAGGGVALLFPLTKSASALQTSSISTTSAYQVMGGLDWHISPKFFIPISIEYSMLPKSDEVEASWISLRAGVAMPL
ncbi:MAG: outer membrane protein [Bdellovibrionales bacterium]